MTTRKEKRKLRRANRKARKKSNTNFFQKLKISIMENFLTNLLAGFLQKLNPKTYAIIAIILGGLTGITAVPEFTEVAGEAGTWVVRVVAFLGMVLTGATPGPNGEVEEPVESK